METSPIYSLLTPIHPCKEQTSSEVELMETKESLPLSAW